MAEDIVTNETSEEKTKVVKAEVGNTILIKSGTEKGTKAKVVVVRDNSVIVDYGKNPKTGEPYKTIVNHKNYKLVK
ncbi:DUF2187 family protein [Metabacillus sediminilitoris]|uniref:DUF2187 domain-containing protein n=1 Tax=Metabacillus sediminilitoris TaxID=2567941 RepID=A0A4V3WG55_9BACI|nr:DUF2187 family protein [Metabacillus sediminilitoris]QGQ45384.1 DUF2187 domain-containing protein [Metabacillus sediminilitoris]THF82317.1 DUF2187 domain-containing protein [Metabacillus sediminilitoris]